MFTRQHYKAIAEIIKTAAFWSCQGSKRENRCKIILPESLSYDLADYFAQDNPRFDRQKFIEACGIGS